MGNALVQGLIRSGLAAAGDITGVTRSEESGDKFLALEPGLKWMADAPAAVSCADVVLLGVKPFQILDVLRLIGPAQPETLYISVAAGVPLASMLEVLGSEARLVRAMPNTPVVVGEGVTGFAVSERVSEQDRAWLLKMFGSLGKAYEVREEELDAVTALSGSGPAYFYAFVEALEKGAIEQGLRPEYVREMAAQTALGAAKMLLAGKGTPAELIAQVKSKGGTTEAALNVFAERDLSGSVGAAVAAAAKRSKELSGAKK